MQSRKTFIYYSDITMKYLNIISRNNKVHPITLRQGGHMPKAEKILPHSFLTLAGLYMLASSQQSALSILLHLL